MSTPLHEIENRSGARFATFFDVQLPASYGDVAAECTAVRNTCGLIDASFRSLLRVTGSDRVDFLQGMLTNQMKALLPGDGIEAAHLTAQGRVIADMRVFALENEIWLDVPVQRKSVLQQTLERYLVADDVEIIDAPTIVPLFSCEGPNSFEVTARVFGCSFDELKRLAHVERELDGEKLRIANVSHTGERGLLMFGDGATAAILWQRLHEAGAVPFGMEALDILRVEAGIPWCDRDMDESVLAPEVGLEAAISFNKGCYIGQEVVERVAARGQVQRRLVGLICTNGAVPAPGAKLHRDGAEVGAVTSAVRSMAMNSVIALAFVRRSSWDVGTVVEVEGGGSAQVASLPFYSAES